MYIHIHILTNIYFCHVIQKRLKRNFWLYKLDVDLYKYIQITIINFENNYCAQLNLRFAHLNRLVKLVGILLNLVIVINYSLNY